MKNCNAPKNQTTRRILLSALATALTVAFAVSLAQPAQAQQITVPPVPDNLQVQEGARAFFVGHAFGTQNYICLPCTPGPTCTTGFAYSLFTPEATLFNDDLDQRITHFFSVNPDPRDNGAIRPTWESSRDTSTVWAKGVAQADHNTDPTFVEQGAIPWVLLNVVGFMNGPTGGDRLRETTQIQRLNTRGGSAPSVGCSSLPDVGTRAFIPYRADYFFYHGPDSDK